MLPLQLRWVSPAHKPGQSKKVCWHLRSLSCSKRCQACKPVQAVSLSLLLLLDNTLLLLQDTVYVIHLFFFYNRVPKLSAFLLPCKMIWTSCLSENLPLRYRNISVITIIKSKQWLNVDVKSKFKNKNVKNQQRNRKWKDKI